jgi:hypothetical protein
MAAICAENPAQDELSVNDLLTYGLEKKYVVICSHTSTLANLGRKMRVGSYLDSYVEKIGDQAIGALRLAQVRTTQDLLMTAAIPKARKSLAARTCLDEKLLLKWANIADRVDQGHWQGVCRTP